MSASVFHPALRLVRRPSELGPVISCAGELSVDTAEMLRRELQSLLPLGHPRLIVDFSRCRFEDVDGMLTVLEAMKQVSEGGLPVVVIAGTGWMARLLKVAGFDQTVTVFPDEETATVALQTGVPGQVAPTWEAAWDETLENWREIRDALDRGATAEAERRLTAMMAFCERAEAIFREHRTPAVWRCQACPLFHVLGARPIDVGCRSLTDPILDALRAHDLRRARRLIDGAIGLLEQMPLPGEVAGPFPIGSA